MKDLEKKLQADQGTTRYLFLFVVAGHGMNYEGRQVVLLNEFDAKRKFYKWWNIEERIRKFAARFENSHFLAFFACCREYYNKEKH